MRGGTLCVVVGWRGGGEDSGEVAAQGADGVVVNVRDKARGAVEVCIGGLVGAGEVCGVRLGNRRRVRGGIVAVEDGERLVWLLRG